ncbi:Uncharacterised protein [Haemophilus parahaemolyticus]|uniref:Uncharacterized protein n=1 Tax=Haemophilus parahaemolyticus TaxID=735 RepID=A0A377I538_HAEPH|nr:Uncharacterised protein [Haemophilus parahaemolyticus]
MIVLSLFNMLVPKKYSHLASLNENSYCLNLSKLKFC